MTVTLALLILVTLGNTKTNIIVSIGINVWLFHRHLRKTDRALADTASPGY
jgi:hypothetical protein